MNNLIDKILLQENINHLSFMFEEISKTNHRIYWHGSASGDLRGGISGLHVGSHKAATQALEARIGVPAKGEWDGTREYGKTLLMGKENLIELQKSGNFKNTGINCDAPQKDYYPTEILEYPDGSKMPMTVKPNIKPYKIVGAMSNTPSNPHEDFKANGYMNAQLKRGTAKRGYYYNNIGEDNTYPSATVPNGSHLKEI